MTAFLWLAAPLPRRPAWENPGNSVAEISKALFFQQPSNLIGASQSFARHRVFSRGFADRHRKTVQNGRAFPAPCLDVSAVAVAVSRRAARSLWGGDGGGALKNVFVTHSLHRPDCARRPATIEVAPRASAALQLSSNTRLYLCLPLPVPRTLEPAIDKNSSSAPRARAGLFAGPGPKSQKTRFDFAPGRAAR